MATRKERRPRKISLGFYHDLSPTITGAGCHYTVRIGYESLPKIFLESLGIEISSEYCDLITRRLNKPIPLFEGAI